MEINNRSGSILFFLAIMAIIVFAYVIWHGKKLETTIFSGNTIVNISQKQTIITANNSSKAVVDFNQRTSVEENINSAAATIAKNYFSQGMEDERLRLLAKDYGADKTDHLSNQYYQAVADFNYLTNAITKIAISNPQRYRLQGQMYYANKSAVELLNALRERKYEVEREIKQLQIDQQRQFIWGK